MTRPKVPEDKRQRTAQACDICKRRKQKCNGQTPCNTCIKRKLSCHYTPNTSPISISTNHNGPPAKRRHIERDPRIGNIPPSPTLSAINIQDGPPIPFSRTGTQGPINPFQFRRAAPVLSRDPRVRQNSSSNEQDEEAEVYGQTRMLQDPTGRLLYVGDSATLSYLQLIRMIVDSAAGSSPFTLDPNRHMILEAFTINLPLDVRIPPILPDRETAAVLVNAFFTNTQGIIEVFDRQAFTESFDHLYSNPLSVNPTFLCLLYLTLAIGLVLATPMPNTPEESIVQRLRSDPVDRAEAYFRGAQTLGDPVTGFEDADFWSVQALCLMSVYKLTVSRRNAAYAYYGMAVRSGFALGLHRIGDTTLIFDSDQVIVRRKLWRSLFVLDRFLATSLGRPTAIQEEDCSADALDSPKPLTQDGMQPPHDNLSSRGLDAAVKTCQSIGHILKKVYSKRRISTKLAQEIAGECEMWNRRIHPDLSASNLFNGTITAAQGMAILHVQLLACHSIILLTRPFFLYLLIRAQKDKHGSSKPPRRYPSRLERFSEACVAASTQTIALVQTAFQSAYLPQRNPFVLYFLFAATLIILSNEFAALYRNRHFIESVANAINIIKYCSTTDAQAKRLVFIVTSFHAEVEKQNSRNDLIQRTRSMNMDLFDGNIADPLAHLASAQQTFLDQQAKMSISTLTSPRTSLPSISLGYAASTNTSMAGLRSSLQLQDESIMGIEMSPSSSRTASSSQTRSAQLATEGSKSDSLGADHEFDFDSFWDFQSPPPLEVTNQMPDTQMTSGTMQPPAAVIETSMFAPPPALNASVDIQGQNGTTPDIRTVPLFSAVNYKG